MSKAKNLAILGVGFSALCRCMGAVSGAILFSNSEKQCTGSLAQNYSNAYSNSLPTLMNATSETKIYSTEEILYWTNILLNCWFGIIASKQILSQLGVRFYAAANAFSAISYFVMLLALGARQAQGWWFTYAAFWYLPYVVAAGVVFGMSLPLGWLNNFEAVALPSDVYYIRWANQLSE